MKKFFGLKMTLAALAVVSLASCYDSESGDVIMPYNPGITWPDPVYVVQGTVYDWDNGDVLEGVNVGGVIDATTTDANGQYLVKLSSPVNGDVVFSKEGYFKSYRPVKMVTLSAGDGNVVYNVGTDMIAENSAAFARAIIFKDVTTDDGTAKTLDAAGVAAIEAYCGENIMTNNTDIARPYDLPAFLCPEQPYGVIAVESKSLEEDGQAAFIKWAQQLYGNDPFEGYGVYNKWRTYPVTIPAMFKVTSIVITPIVESKTIVFPFNEGDYEQAVEVIDSYKVEVKGVALDHTHGHAHGGASNAGGGSGE